MSIEIRRDSDDEIDEIISDGERLHIEMLDTDCAMLIVGDCHMTIYVEKGALKFVVREWDRG